MAITILAGQDLVAALHRGTLGSPPWEEFLDGLRRRTGADFAGILLSRGQEQPEIIALEAEQGPARFLARDQVDELIGVGPSRRSALRAKRVYSSAELTGGGQSDFLQHFMTERDLTQLRIMRIADPGGSQMWAMIGRRRGDFTGADASLLGSLADHFEIALGTWAALERERMRAGITADAMRRLNFGWLILDPQGRIADLSDEAEVMLQGGGALQRAPDGRLRPVSREAQAGLRRFLEHANRGEQLSRAVHLSDEPWLDMLLTTSPGAMRERAHGTIIVAFVHGEQPGSEERSVQLAELFGLTAQESRLALLISRGVKIAEAAQTLGITVETARLYSKRIYAKTGTRGQADLVRLILASIVALS
ncbi:helix-turn-helix transcriptional regulator [Altererythrobacter sp.]|uniref:helix-turn-helix transcriptional regulator n=1 Tax=Altererythrobacter sp. TaxID=1872480 RepID=UPI003CFFAFDF